MNSTFESLDSYLSYMNNCGIHFLSSLEPPKANLQDESRLRRMSLRMQRDIRIARKSLAKESPDLKGAPRVLGSLGKRPQVEGVLRTLYEVLLEISGDRESFAPKNLRKFKKGGTTDFVRRHFDLPSDFDFDKFVFLLSDFVKRTF
jgi:hypothetical protein